MPRHIVQMTIMPSIKRKYVTDREFATPSAATGSMHKKRWRSLNIVRFLRYVREHTDTLYFDTHSGFGDVLSTSMCSGVGDVAENKVDGCEVWMSAVDRRLTVVVVVVVAVPSGRRLINALSVIAGDCSIQQ